MTPTASTETSSASCARVDSATDASGATVLRLSGRLDTDATARVWPDAMRLAGAAASGTLVVDASDLEYCNGAGAGLLIALAGSQRERGGSFTLHGLRDDLRRIVGLIEPSAEAPGPPGEAESGSPVARLGYASLELVEALRSVVAFVGHLTLALLGVLRHPRRLRLKDAFAVAETAGIGATPIIALVGFLLGLILAFQSAIPMRQFGAQIFVADLLGISTIRELGALMAAIILTARSGSAFAAELGTMKINEEIDALTTMGLEPVRFLIVPRVLAAVAMVPVLTMLMSFFILLGGAVVMSSLGFPLVTYVNRIAAIVTVGDLVGGLVKAFFFGIVVAAVGCHRGLRTGTGAGAVGASATSAVVSGIVLIATVDGVFAVAFYVLGI